MIDEELTQKVREAWKLFSAQNEGSRKPTEEDQRELDLLIDEFRSHYGLIVEFNITDDKIPDATWRHEECPAYVGDSMDFPPVDELTKNIRQHAETYSPSGDLIRVFGHGYWISRFSHDRYDRKFFEVYVFDQGVGFTSDGNGVPQIGEGIKERTSLTRGGDSGVGLTRCVERSDFWEIESNGYSLKKDSPLEKVDPIQGTMVHLVKYV